MSSDSNELYYAEMEAARNSACDAYFEARPQIDRPDRRAAFNSGFERAFALVWHGGRAAQETPAEDICPTTGQPHRMPKGQVCIYCHIGNLGQKPCKVCGDKGDGDLCGGHCCLNQHPS